MTSLTPYRQLSAERRVSLVTRAIKQSRDMRAMLVARMVSRGGGFRAVTLMQWPAEKLAREMVRLGAETAEDELNLLNLLYVELEPQIQSTFLDAAGVAHTNGQMAEELQAPFASADAVQRAARVVAERFGEDGRHYLVTIAKYNGEGWPGIEAVVASLSGA